MLFADRSYPSAMTCFRPVTPTVLCVCVFSLSASPASVANAHDQGGSSLDATAEQAGGSHDDALTRLGSESSSLELLRLAEDEIIRATERLPDIFRAGGAQTASVPTSSVSATEMPSGPSATSIDGYRLPDVGLRVSDQVLGQIAHYRDDPRGRASYEAFLDRGRPYAALIRAELRAAGAPEDLIYVSMLESGFDARARSSVGALGPWQFMARTGEAYGLPRDLWTDSRMDFVQSTRAAARYLLELHERLGSWELVLAAYNMGYGGVLKAMRKYNTNDFFTLARAEAGLPYETTTYVARITAFAILGRNLERAGFAPFESQASLARVRLPGGTTLAHVAQASRVDLARITALNAQYRRNRLPPRGEFEVLVPASVASDVPGTVARLRQVAPRERIHTVLFGEGVPEVAERYGSDARTIARMNGIETTTALALGTEIFVPDTEPQRRAAGDRPIVYIPSRDFAYTDRNAVYYRVVEGDTLSGIAEFFHVTLDDLRRWNDVDVRARLVRGLTIRIFVASSMDLTNARVLTPEDVDVVTVGSDDFFARHEELRGRDRRVVQVLEGDTLESIARRYDLSVGSVSRINRIPRTARLVAGDSLIVYAPRPVPARAPTAPRSRPEAPTTIAPTPAETPISAVAESANPVQTTETPSL